MPDLVIVKLGGSLITDKQGDSVLRPEVLGRLCREIAAGRAVAAGREGLDGGLIVTHGSGSFGHVAARRHHFVAGRPLRSERGVSEIQAAAHALHGFVIKALIDAGVECFSIVPGSAAISGSGDEGSLFFEEPLRLALELGLVPVTGGDVVLDAELRGTILSTEALLVAMVARFDSSWFRVRKVLWMGETDGVLDSSGLTVATIDDESAQRVLEAVGASAGTDVTGGMRLRVETALSLARQGVESKILNGLREGCLEQALAGDAVGGTTIEPVSD